jgi:protein SCO1/2
VNRFGLCKDQGELLKVGLPILAALALVLPASAFAQGMGMQEPQLDPASKKPVILQKVGIDQKIGQQLPLDLHFTDERGATVRLGQYFGTRPVVLALAYYECPMLCTHVLNGMAGALKTLTFEAGKDFDVVVVSINPREGPQLASEKKTAYLETYGRPHSARSWHFLTGKEPDIQTLAAALGFRYAYDDRIQQYAHAAAIYVATPAGVVARYFLGIEFPPRDLRFALVEASQNRLGTIGDKVLLLCYHYDPATGRYGAIALGAVRIGGVLTIVAFLAFLFVSLRNERRAESAKQI